MHTYMHHCNHAPVLFHVCSPPCLCAPVECAPVLPFTQDGKTFVHIAAWLGPKTLAHSVTLISGGCLAAATASSGGGAAADATAFANFSGALAAAAQDGCNVRSVDNSSLINPTLLKYGSLPTPQPLLVLITSNVSLGWGLNPGAIPVHRPVVLVGLFSVPTSVDMHMVVNQLNATCECFSHRECLQHNTWCVWATRLAAPLEQHRHVGRADARRS